MHLASSSPELGPRATWLAGEATWISHAETHRILPDLIEGMSTASIVKAMQEMFDGHLRHEDSPLTPFWMASAGLNALSGSLTSDEYLQKLLPGPARQRFNAHTFEEEPDKVMAEGLKTMIHFPVNLLFYANLSRPDGSKPLVSSIEDIARTYKSDWFYHEIAASASAANGYWREMSINALYPKRIQAMKPRAHFTYDEASPSRFSLHSDTRAEIRLERAKRNASALDSGYEVETYQNGSTATCPGIRRKPKIDDLEARASLAAAYTVDPETITTMLPETAVRYGLSQLADYLGTVALIDRTISKRLT